ncbi:MAG: adenylosuccinate synthetase [Alteromonas sp.]|nr:adenylosuccinate synthetase [Alteromonas sp.]MAY22467.1 adenylosuccinate synthetase [Flavobacteriaceae bacterium]|tara:strand:+ start:3562 stop:3738 length:177 start_codon:yes stop_codon:yes gene_type:complete
MKIQIPTEVPNPDNNTPIELTNIFDILVFVVAPIVLIILYFVLRKRAKNKKAEDSENE